MNVFRKAKSNKDDDVKMLLFECPACGCYHAVWIANKPGKPVWEWNGSMTKPTVKPSLLIRSEDTNGKTVCHLFIRNGKIKYLNDCTHDMAGKTVPMIGV